MYFSIFASLSVCDNNCEMGKPVHQLAHDCSTAINPHLSTTLKTKDKAPKR